MYVSLAFLRFATGTGTCKPFAPVVVDCGDDGVGARGGICANVCVCVCVFPELEVDGGPRETYLMEH